MDDTAPLPPRRTRSGSQTRQRTSRPSMPCTPTELAALNVAADKAGLSVGAFMRHQCLQEPGPRAVRRITVERRALAQLLGQLGKCGSNLNQIARVLNSGGEPRVDIAEAIADIRHAALAISHTLRGEAM